MNRSESFLAPGTEAPFYVGGGMGVWIRNETSASLLVRLEQQRVGVFTVVVRPELAVLDDADAPAIVEGRP